MALRVQQILFRPAMGIMAGNARCRSRLLPLMGAVKFGRIQIVTLDTELFEGLRSQVGVIGPVGAVAGGAILGGGRVQGAVPPVFGHFFVAAETEGRLAFFQIAGMR